MEKNCKLGLFWAKPSHGAWIASQSLKTAGCENDFMWQIYWLAHPLQKKLKQIKNIDIHRK